MKPMIVVSARWMWLTFCEGVIFGSGVTVAGGFLLYMFWGKI
jgi:hypothetical protein